MRRQKKFLGVPQMFVVHHADDSQPLAAAQRLSVVIDPGSGNLDPVINPKFGDDLTYPTIDGFFITVQGPPPLINETRTGHTGTEWWTGSDARFVVGGPGATPRRFRMNRANWAHFPRSSILSCVAKNGCSRFSIGLHRRP